jgi:pimeloyl-ACP methyl ester carboxylesterase
MPTMILEATYTRRVLFALACAFLSCAASAEDVQLDHGGLRLNGQLASVDSWPAGVSLLIVHGTLSHNRSEIIQTLQSLFLEEGISSLAINLGLGVDNRRGSFDCAAPHRHTHRQALEELTAWSEWLRGRGAGRIAVLGHSRGANQVAQWTRGEPDAVVGQVLVAPPAPSPGTSAAPPLVDPALLARARELVAAGRGEELLELPRFLYCRDVSVSAASLLSYYGDTGSHDTAAILRDVALPTLVVTGSEDTTTPGLDVAYRPLVVQGRLELLTIDGADHFFRDLYADELVEFASEFLHRPAPEPVSLNDSAR